MEIEVIKCTTNDTIASALEHIDTNNTYTDFDWFSLNFKITAWTRSHLNLGG